MPMTRSQWTSDNSSTPSVRVEGNVQNRFQKFYGLILEASCTEMHASCVDSTATLSSPFMSLCSLHHFSPLPCSALARCFRSCFLLYTLNLDPVEVPEGLLLTDSANAIDPTQIALTVLHHNVSRWPMPIIIATCEAARPDFSCLIALSGS